MAPLKSFGPANRPTFSYLVLLLVLALTMASCGSDDNDSAPSAGSNPSAATGSSTPAPSGSAPSSQPVQQLILSADRQQTTTGGPPVTLAASGVSDPVQTTWALGSGSQGSLSASSGARVQYTPPPAGTAVTNGVVLVSASNGSANASVSIVLSAGTSAGAGTAGAGTVTSPVPNAGTATVSPGIFLISGNDFGAGIADGAGMRARFDTPTGIARDAQGNLYVADRFNSTIRKIATDGTVSTLAGLAGAQGHADGSGTAARFVTPWGLALASDGSLFVSDPGDQTIRRVTQAGGVSTVAGVPALTEASLTADPARRLSSPRGIAVATDGSLYVADNRSVRRIAADGTISTVAGQLDALGAQDGAASIARFTSLQGLAMDSAGNIYVVDSGLVPGSIPSGSFNVASSIRKISPSGTVSTLAGAVGTSLDVTGFADGTGSAARFRFPEGLALDAAGNLVVGDSLNHAIRRVSPDGVVSTLAGTSGQAGSADGTLAQASFNAPSGIALAPDGSIFVSDTASHTVRRLVAGGQVSTLAGAAPLAGSTDGQRGQALFNAPLGLSRDSAGILYVADSGNQCIRRIAPDGAVTTFAGAASQAGAVDGTGAQARFNLPRDVAANATGDVFVADFLNRAIRRITPAAQVTTYAGALGEEGFVDGPAASARFVEPQAVAADASGNVYVADRAGDTLRKINPAGEVSTFAGLNGSSGTSDGLGTSARLGLPQDVAVDRAGTVYFIDSGTLVRKVTPEGQVTSLAGKAFEPGTVDGTGTAARFNFPQSLDVDDAGNVYVADSRAIRRISPQGVVTTVAGASLPAANEQLRNVHRPAGLVVTGPGRVAFTAGDGVFELRLP